MTSLVLSAASTACGFGGVLPLGSSRRPLVVSPGGFPAPAADADLVEVLEARDVDVDLEQRILEVALAGENGREPARALRHAEQRAERRAAQIRLDHDHAAAPTRDR